MYHVQDFENVAKAHAVTLIEQEIIISRASWN